LVLGAVPRHLEGIASGANAAFRELGGVLGIAVLGAIFSSHGSYASGQDYVNGMTPAVYVGAVVVAIGAGAALLVPGRRRSRSPVAADAVDLVPELAGTIAVTGPSLAGAGFEDTEDERSVTVGARRPLCATARTTA
jgi:hypothetical protein